MYYNTTTNPKEFIDQNPSACLKEARNAISLDNPHFIFADAVAGLGHCQQAHYLRYTLTYYLGVRPENITNVTVNPTGLDRGNGPYAWLQQHPRTYTLLANFLVRLPPNLLDHRTVNSFDDCQTITKATNHLDHKTPLIFITTHAAAATSVLLWGERNKSRNWTLVEFCPDPYQGLELGLMTTPLTSTDHPHLTCLHDEPTVKSYNSFRAATDYHITLSTGTSSPPEYLFEPPQPTNNLHLIATANGNSSPSIHQQLLDFMTSVAAQVLQGDVKFSLLTLTHNNFHSQATAVAKRLGLDRSDNFHLSVQPDRHQAVSHRHQVLAGQTPFGPPTAVLYKGEGPLTDLGSAMVGVTSAGGHEAHNLRTGIHCGRATDLRQYHPSQYFGTLTQAQKNPNRPTPPQSRAHLAILYATTTL